LSQVKKIFRFQTGTEPDIIPQRVGKTAQWFRYTLLGANTTPSAEGTVGTGLALATTTVSATVSEYSDFATLSSLLEETAIDPITQNYAEQLGYRAGLSVDIITRNEFDANASANVATAGANCAAVDVRRAVSVLRANDVQPRANDKFLGIFHPYIIYDLKSDNTAGGFMDLARYGLWAQGAVNYMKDYQDELGMGIVGEVEGCLIKSSTSVTTTGTAPTQLYNSYVIGQGAVGSVDLAGRGPSRIEYPTKENFRINVIRGGPQIADPEGKIGSAVSYRFVYVAKTLDTAPLRFRIIQADSSLI
jgi:N4-gp56 family major capsid protein